MSPFFLSPLMGPFYYVLKINAMGIFCMIEGNALFQKQTKKASINTRITFISYALYFTNLFALLPRVVVRPKILENSGFPKSEYPLVHEILYEQNEIIFTVSLCVIFFIFVTGLRAGSIKYQINNFGASIMLAVVISHANEGVLSCFFFG